MKLKQWNNSCDSVVQKWNNKTCQCECENYHKCKKDCSCNPSQCTCDNNKYLKRIPDTSVIGCD